VRVEEEEEDGSERQMSHMVSEEDVVLFNVEVRLI
jgi:hypothetical protein